MILNSLLLAYSYGGQDTSAFKEFLLQDSCVYELPVGISAPTTIYFPGRMESIEGVGITKGDSKAPIQFTYTEGKPFFTVKASKEGAEGSLNIVFKGKVYALRLIGSTDPFRRVRFQETAKSISLTELGNRNFQPVTPNILLSLLDQAKLYPLLIESHPTLAENITFSQPRTIDDYGRFWVVVDEVIRFEKEDTLVFRVLLKNKTEQPIYYAPQSLAAQVGDQLYMASLVDASGVLPANESTCAYFCITGKADGGRANLSLKNRFQIVIYEINPTNLRQL